MNNDFISNPGAFGNYYNTNITFYKIITASYIVYGINIQYIFDIIEH